MHFFKSLTINPLTLASLSMKAVDALVSTKVTGFTSPMAAKVIYLGSFLWFLLMVAVDTTLLASRDWPRLDSLLGTLIGVNTLGYVLQSVDAVYFHMRAWPIVAGVWVCQLYSIVMVAAALGYALSMDVPHDELVMRHVVIFLRAAAQCVYTASQFSVTLEYLHRAVTVRTEKFAVKVRPTTIAGRV